MIRSRGRGSREGTQAGRRGSRSEHTWRSGGSSVARWDGELIGWAALLLGAGILLATLADRMIGGTLGSALSLVALWGGMLAAIVLALVRSRPRMLLRWRWLDLLYGVVLGILLRLSEGYLQIAGTGSAGWPRVAALDGALPASFWFDGVAGAVLVAPVLEEFFFRGVLLVALYTVVRRMTDSRSWAGAVSVIVTTVLFVGMHLVFDPAAWWSLVAVGLVGLVCGALVATTARIWGAVLVHVVFNGVWVAMVLVGTLAR